MATRERFELSQRTFVVFMPESAGRVIGVSNRERSGIIRLRIWLPSLLADGDIGAP